MFAKVVLSVLALASFVAAQPSVHVHAARGYKKNAGLLEPYDQYHTRITQLDCQAETDKGPHSFYEQCCHPMKKGEKLSSRPEECDPMSSYYEDCHSTTSTSSHHAPTSTTKHHTSSTTKHHTSTKTTSHHAKPTKPSHHDGGNDWNTGGYATYYYQNGNAGACGKYSSDNDLIAAIDKDWYGPLNQKSPMCGEQIDIQNIATGVTITVTIQDVCPTCANSNSVDLSKGAFLKLGTLDQGMLKIQWKKS